MSYTLEQFAAECHDALKADPGQAGREKVRQCVVKALKEGTSLAVAPEGTRSGTGALLPFNKGPFHMAIHGQVPMVPVVIRNAGEIMTPHSYLINPGTVDVVVLPPVDTSDWTTETVEKHRAKVMQKLELHNLSELIKYAIRKGLIDVNEG